MTREQINQHRDAGTITNRQAEILHLRRRGFSQNTIALGLGISRSTVRSIERDAHHKLARHQEETAA